MRVGRGGGREGRGMGGWKGGGRLSLRTVWI
jgi:hypothetical protein